MPATGAMDYGVASYNTIPPLRDLFDRAVHIHKLQLIGAHSVQSMPANLGAILAKAKDAHDQYKADANIVSSLVWQQLVEESITALQAVIPTLTGTYLLVAEVTLSGLELLLALFPPTPAPAA
jgi:hypothetical protein